MQQPCQTVTPFSILLCCRIHNSQGVLHLWGNRDSYLEVDM